METVNESDVDAETTERGEFGFERRQLGAATDADDLGCSRYEIPPGKAAWPFHYHTANEEAIYVLAGTGKLRGPGSKPAGNAQAADEERDDEEQDDQRATLEPGTYASFPAGPEGAHRIENTGDEPLELLAISTMHEPEVLVYPDSGKIGVMAGQPPGGESDERSLDANFRQDDAVDYWDGEG